MAHPLLPVFDPSAEGASVVPVSSSGSPSSSATVVVLIGVVGVVASLETAVGFVSVGSVEPPPQAEAITAIVRAKGQTRLMATRYAER